MEVLIASSILRPGKVDSLFLTATAYTEALLPQLPLQHDTLSYLHVIL